VSRSGKLPVYTSDLNRIIFNCCYITLTACKINILPHVSEPVNLAIVVFKKIFNIVRPVVVRRSFGNGLLDRTGSNDCRSDQKHEEL
jgi:hypothetical protein